MDGIILELVLQICAAMVGTVAFSLLFGVPRTYYPWCGIIGGAGWAVYSQMSPMWSPASAAFTATMVVIFLSRAAAVRQKCHYFSYIGHLSPCSGRRNLLDRVLSDYGAAQTGRLYRI